MSGQTIYSSALLARRVCETASDYRLSLYNPEFAKANGGKRALLDELERALDAYERACDEESE